MIRALGYPADRSTSRAACRPHLSRRPVRARTRPPHHPRRSMAGRRVGKLALLVGLFALLLGGLTACEARVTGTPHSGITAPEVFYLSPHGDKSGPANKAPFHLVAKDIRVRDNTGSGDHRLTIDLRGAGGSVRLWIKSGRNCEGTDTHVVCRLQGWYDSWVQSDRVYPTATKKGKAGDSATVDFTFSAKDGKKITGHTRVVVGEPVVQLQVQKAIKGAEPGAGVSTAVAVRNTGEVPVRGLGLLIHAGDSSFRQRYSNCRYPPQMKGREAICAFPDLRIEPGETVLVRPTLPLRTGKVKIFSEIRQEAWPLDVGPAKDSAVPDNGDKGAGPALEATAAPKGTGGTFAGGVQRVPVSLDLRSDYQVTASELHVGEKRELHLTVRDNGPGDPGGIGHLLFTPPPGAVVREQPMEEIDDGVYEPGCDLKDGTYECDRVLSYVSPGNSRVLDFTLDLPQPGTGHVAFRMETLETGGLDPNLDDNSAEVIVLP
ncbi:MULTISPECIES: hypothetical protein [unclassified Streptomyces]|uniref:hypothetical protein n=1 Tax=unclassified Streptomyces TaxID=2593676 RepID=UPI0036E7D801